MSEGKWYEVIAKFEVERPNGKSLVEHTFRFWDVTRGQYDWGQTTRAAIRAGMELASHQGELISASSNEMADCNAREAGLDPEGPKERVRDE